jgi:arabinofuranosyltransferase
MPGSPHPNQKGGHYIRELPEGYLETFTKPGTQLADPSLQQYFGIIVSITRGPIFRWQRFQHIWEMNLGRHQHLLNEYLSRKRSG